MEKIDKPQLQRKQMGLAFAAQGRSGQDVVTGTGLTKSYGDSVLLKDVDLHIRFRERVAIVGANGSGKSTLVKMMMGQVAVDTGELRIGESDINLLILDEPTNHLDIESREALESALDEFDGTIIAISHDRHFINQLFQRVLWLQEGTVDAYHGNYDDAREKRAETHSMLSESKS